MRDRGNLTKENEELKIRLKEAEELVAAIKKGAVDAFVTDDSKVFTLKGADHTYRVLIETMHEGAATLTVEGMVMYCNRRLAKMLAVPVEGIIGNSIFDFIPAQETSRLRSVLKQSQDRDIRTEFLLKKKDGDLIPALVSCNSLKLDNAGLCMVITDLTAQKKTEDELMRHRDHLEDLVEERTADLQVINKKLEKVNKELFVSNDELVRFNRAMVDREMRVIELKKQVNELNLKAGKPAPYPLKFKQE